MKQLTLTEDLGVRCSDKKMYTVIFQIILPLLISCPAFFLTFVVNQMLAVNHSSTGFYEISQGFLPVVYLWLQVVVCQGNQCSRSVDQWRFLRSFNFYFLETCISSAFHKSVASCSKYLILVFSYWFYFCEWTWPIQEKGMRK